MKIDLTLDKNRSFLERFLSILKSGYLKLVLALKEISMGTKAAGYRSET
ncbi:hypothetical protein [Alkalicoccus saliphilus]|nr:hypothetical protein [Alkalicoccus saliphilus]